MHSIITLRQPPHPSPRPLRNRQGTSTAAGQKYSALQGRCFRQRHLASAKAVGTRYSRKSSAPMPFEWARAEEEVKRVEQRAGVGQGFHVEVLDIYIEAARPEIDGVTSVPTRESSMASRARCGTFYVDLYTSSRRTTRFACEEAEAEAVILSVPPAKNSIRRGEKRAIKARTFVRTPPRASVVAHGTNGYHTGPVCAAARIASEPARRSVVQSWYLHPSAEGDGPESLEIEAGHRLASG
ncbi:hypothetical protein B0H12DRAFT_1069677 [Mycena haematopus]|nr:hypothetical protein B0H12DRAFT_1069677 [Mycena haematopus]